MTASFQKSTTALAVGLLLFQPATSFAQTAPAGCSNTSTRGADACWGNQSALLPSGSFVVSDGAQESSQGVQIPIPNAQNGLPPVLENQPVPLKDAAKPELKAPAAVDDKNLKAEVGKDKAEQPKAEAAQKGKDVKQNARNPDSGRNPGNGEDPSRVKEPDPALKVPGDAPDKPAEIRAAPPQPRREKDARRENGARPGDPSPSDNPAAQGTPDARRAPADSAAPRRAQEADRPRATDPSQPARQVDQQSQTDQQRQADQPRRAPGTDSTPEIDAARSGDRTRTGVVTQQLTRENTRSSREDFKTSASPDRKKKKDGLSDLEKAGLIALGAVVVGTILSNQQEVVTNSGDRVVVRDRDGEYRVYKDDDALLRRAGTTVRTENFRDGSTRSFVERADGSQIITIRDANGRIERRIHVDRNGRETVLIDDTRESEAVDLRRLRDLDRRDERTYDYSANDDRDALRRALMQSDQAAIGRTFSLRQIREIREVRELAPEINLNAITFETGSAAIPVYQAERLRQLGNALNDLIGQNPREIFLIEGHTDAVGDPAYNLALSDRRAESVALALTEYFDVPPENMVVQGYGERFLKVPDGGAESRNRRATARRITDLLN